MRILILVSLFPPSHVGGHEFGALDIAQGLVRYGHEITVLTSDYVADDVRPLAGAVADLKLQRILCFNLAGLGPAGILQYLAGPGRRPVVFLADNPFRQLARHASEPKRFESVFGRAGYIDDIHFAFISQSLRNEVESCLGQSVPHSTIIPGWADMPTKSRKAVDVLPKPRRFIFASRISGNQGIHVLLDAVALLAQVEKWDFVVEIFGAGEVSDFLERVSARGLERWIRYEGDLTKQELARRFADYEALLFPTWPREPFGSVVLEAAAAGCLPIMTRGIGAAEWYLHGVDCLKIDHTANSLAAAMANFMDAPAEEVATMRRRTCAVTGRNLTFERSLGRIEKLLVSSTGSVRPVQECRVEGPIDVLSEIWRAGGHA